MAIQQQWDPEAYARDAGFVSELAEGVIEWLAPRPGERILDLGCGDGAVGERLARMGCRVVGVDNSADMLRAARRRGLEVVLADGERLPFEQEFDAVFSNAALHWMPDARAVAEGVFRALRPRGRFVGEFGGHGNVAAIITAMRAVARRRGGEERMAGPWFFPTSEEYAALLESVGFRVKRIALLPRPTPLRSGLGSWLRIFRPAFFEQFGEDAALALAEVEELLRPVLCDTRGNWTVDYVRLRFEAVKEAS